MTPLEWLTFVQGWNRRQEIEDKRAVTCAWLGAKLTRVSEFPSLESLLTPPVVAKELAADEAERQNTLMAVIADRLKAREERQKDTPHAE